MSIPKYSSTFIFEARNLTDEFERIDSEIAQRARRIPGFLGEEAWTNDETGLHSEVYYWTDLSALRELIDMDTHQVAKSRHAEWLGDYKVVIAEVKSVYGSSELALEHSPSPAKVES